MSTSIATAWRYWRIRGVASGLVLGLTACGGGEPTGPLVAVRASDVFQPSVTLFLPISSLVQSDSLNEDDIMVKWIIERGIRGMEAQLGVELEHLRTMGRVAPGLLGRLALFMPLLDYRRRVPEDVLHMATLGATLAQDCGECLQIAVNVATRAGMAPELVEAAVRGRTDALTDAQAEALLFGERVAAGMDSEDVRVALRARVGEAGIVELASAVAGAQYFPVLKRGMGLSRACRIDAIRYHAA